MKKLLAILLCLMLASGALFPAALAEEAPEVVDEPIESVQETPEEPASEDEALVEPEETPIEVPTDAEPAPEEPAGAPEEAPDVVPEQEEAPDEVEAAEAPAEPAEEAPEEPVEISDEAPAPETAPEEPEAAPEGEEAPAAPEEAPIEEAEAADEGEEIAEEAEFVIPDGLEVDGTTVTGYSGNATSLVIPEGITSIDNWAFSGCTTLKNVTLPESLVTINNYAFIRCSNLTGMTLPANVAEVGEGSFAWCDNLKSFSVDSENTHFSARDGVLFNKDQTRLVLFPKAKGNSYTVPSGVKKIGVGAFFGCNALISVSLPNGLTEIEGLAFEDCYNLTSAIIPNGVFQIGSYAFEHCDKLTSVNLPSSLSSINSLAFYKCANLKSINVDSQNQSFTSVDGVLFNKDRTKLHIYPYGHGNVYTVPDGVTTIAAAAFEGCDEMVSVTLPNTVTTLESYAFNGCSNLLELFAPGSVTSVGTNAFRNCSSLTISGYGGSWIESYAGLNGIPFNSVGDYVPAVTSAKANVTTTPAQQKVTFIVKTDFAAEYLALYSESGTKVTTWTAGANSIADVGVRTWTVQYAIFTTGSRTLTFKASKDGSAYGDGKSVSLTVTEAIPNVTSATVSPSTVTAKTSATFTVKTPKSAKYLTMYAESGSKVKTWTASGNSTVSGSTRTWTVQYAISTAGSRTLTFKASLDGTTYGTGKNVSLTVTAALLNVTSATAAETTVAAKAPVTFTVKTPKDAKYLAMFSEGGTKVKVWGCTNYSKVSGSTRIWTVSYSIANTGTRHLTFKCTKSTTYGEGKTVDLKVVAEQPAVTSASANKSTVAAKETVTFTVKTPAAAKFVALYTESGTKVKAWGMSGNSTVSGDVRTWKIQYAIASKGDRKLTFRASTNGVYGAGKTVSIKVN